MLLVSVSTLRLLTLRFQCRFARPVVPWEFFGATLRGGLGYTLRRFFCIRNTAHCHRCPLTLKCVYRKVFEPEAAAERLSLPGISDVPRPFIFDVTPARAEAPASDIEFRLTLVGEAIKYYHYLIYAVIEMGERGIARQRLPFTVVSVRQEDMPETVLYDEADKVIKPYVQPVAAKWRAGRRKRLTLEFLTPMRIKHNGGFNWQGEFAPLFKSLLRRITLLEDVYCGGSPRREVKELVAAADAVVMAKKKLVWHDLARMSTRQRQLTLHGGYCGIIRYEGDFKQLMPYLRIGEQVHAGHNATFGLGKYRLAD